MDQDDIQLLLAYSTANESAFTKLVERHRQWIYAAARRRLRDDHLADDATQAVFLVLATKAPELLKAHRGSLSPWLFHVMHFTCARLRRSESRREAVLERASSKTLPQELPDSDLLLLLEDTIAQLPAAEREIIVRRFYQRETFAQIGRAMKITAEAARKRVTRILLEIKSLMLRDSHDQISDAFLVDLNRSPRRKQTSDKQPITSKQINTKVKEETAMAEQQSPPQYQFQGGYQLISTEFLVKDVEANLDFFEKLGFPRRFIDKLDANGRIPRASLTAGVLGKIWIRRAPDSEIRPSPSINIFFWIDGGPDALIAHRKKIAALGIPVTPIIDEHGLPNFNVTTPDGYSIAFFTAYVPPEVPSVKLVL